MRKLITLLLMVFVGIGTWGQNTNKIGTTGDIGIGTTNPSARLTVIPKGTIYGTQLNNSGILIGTEINGIGIDDNEIVKKGTGEMNFTSVNGPINFSVGLVPNHINSLCILTDGKIGVGTKSPRSNLHISSQNSGDAILLIESDINNNNEAYNPSLVLKQDGGAVSGIVGLTGDVGSEYSGTLANALYLANTHIGFGIQFITNNKVQMTISHDNNIGIGTSTPEYKLDVAGTIRADEIRVEDIAAANMDLSGDIAANNITIKTNGNTADFVFEPDYQLKDLSEVETFIKTNKHLENIPSATQMEEKGVNLAEMNKLLLQKVEELTLYVIEKDKKIDKLEVARQKEHGELEKLEERLAKIEGLFPRE